ncbi:MAG TPA: hypothetical protein VFT04_14045 [Gemmatimonadales bacterium]|nr:hypothetical protein [Gemmatimonadales bacterium]
MRRSNSFLPVVIVVATLSLAGCGGAGDGGGRSEAESAPPAAMPESAEAVSFTEADVDAFARGLARETGLVREAQARASSATTPEERGAAMQAQWKEQTMPGGAEAAGMTLERYAAVREAITGTLQTLDFQGRIAGPMELDTSRASPEMRRRLAADAYADLPQASAAALQARLDQLVPIWAAYIELTAVGG